MTEPLLPQILDELTSIKKVIRKNENDDYDAHEMRRLINRLERIIERFFKKSSYSELIVDATEANEDLIDEEGDNSEDDLINHVIELLSIAIDNLENELIRFGLPHKNDPKIGHNIVINNQHSINQSQTCTIEIFGDILKDSLTGRQFKEIADIVKTEKEPEKAKSKIVDKLLSFGNNVAANVVSALITNPHLLAGLF